MTWNILTAVNDWRWRSYRPSLTRRLCVIAITGPLAFAAVPAYALSELQDPPPNVEEEAQSDGVERVPLPPPIRLPSTPQQTPEGEAQQGDGAPPRDVVRPVTERGRELPEIHYDLTRLPEPVQRMHDLIVEAARSGDIEKLRPLIGSKDTETRLSLGGVEGDPLDFLLELSGDEEGQEILAILLEVLQSGYVHLDIDTPQEMYVWPYFFAMPLETLDKKQRVELFTLVTAGDYEDMKNFGAYIFYRAGITPEGRWAFFVAGD